MTSPRIGQALPVTHNGADPIAPTYVPYLRADAIETGTLTGAVITVGEDGVIKAGIGSTTVEIVKEGIYGYVENTPVFRLDSDGIYLRGTVEAEDGYFRGTVSAEAIIAGSRVQGANIVGGTITIGDGSSVFRAGNLGIALGGDFLTAPFRVTPEGHLLARDATITGVIEGSEVRGGLIEGARIVGGSIEGADINATGTFATGPRGQAHMRMTQDPGGGVGSLEPPFGLIEWFMGTEQGEGEGARAFIEGKRLLGFAGSLADLLLGTPDVRMRLGWRDTPTGMRKVLDIHADQVWFNDQKMWGTD